MVLTDSRLQTRYILTPDTAWLLRYIMHESRAERAIASAARHRQLTPAEVRHALYKLLGYLNAFGGVRVTHMAYTSMAAIRVRFAWRCRYAVTSLGFCKAMLYSYGALTAVSTGIWCGVCIVYTIPLLWSLLPAAVFVSCVLHEAGHCMVVARVRTPSVLLASCGYAAVAYARPRRQWSRLIAVAGPSMAALPYGIVATCVQLSFIRYMALAVAALHLCSLLPYFADGKTLWRET